MSDPNLTKTAVPPRVQITPHPEWAQKFWDDLVPLKNKIVEHVLFKDMNEGKITREQWQRVFVDFYVLIENFPKFMALNLAKLGSGAAPGHLEARFWLLQNMKIESKHADWWCDWAESLNYTREEIYQAEPNPLMDAINHYLWFINTRGSFVEGLAATNLAIEWPTGEWSVGIAKTFNVYAEQGLTVN